MEYWSKKAVGLVLLGLFCATAVAQSTNSDQQSPLTVTVGVDHSPPYRIVGDDRPSGLYLEIFNEVADRLGWQVEYEPVPFRRLLLLMREGKVDVMLGPRRTDAREDYMAYVTPAFPSERRLFFYMDAENRITRYQDLYGKAIGVLEGARYFPRFDEDEQLQKEAGPRYRNLMMMLEKGRVDVVVAPELAGRMAARGLQEQPHVSPFTVPGQQGWIAISRQSSLVEHVDELGEAVAQVQDDGVMQRLVQKYSNLATR